MIRIGCRVICVDMTGRTCSRRSVETVCMTSTAQKGQVGARQREAVIMVECSTRTACRMARIAGKAVIGITAYSLVAVC
jgi:putative N-acetylmannosamine-6-phosphate epimerase